MQKKMQSGFIPLILKYGLILFNKNTPYKLVQNQIEKFQDLDTIRKE
jgi:hypothetical protein